ncbi:MAG: zinc-ribbon domain-containing protein [Ruminiclostridium sp.]|jgi:uncharacterized membrane protein|nr:zinc-ribbon domain-containing protein [Ruminiclostridium sp.]
MAVCSKCGAQIPDNTGVCPSCGAPQENGANQQAYVNGGNYMDPNDVQQNKVMAVLAYIGILFLVPLLAAPNSQYARFHTNQGLVLFLFDIVVGILTAVLAFIPFIGLIVSSLLGLGVFVLMILGIVNAATGKANELPLIGKIRIIK